MCVSVWAGVGVLQFEVSVLLEHRPDVVPARVKPGAADVPVAFIRDRDLLQLLEVAEHRFGSGLLIQRDGQLDDLGRQNPVQFREALVEVRVPDVVDVSRQRTIARPKAVRQEQALL